LFERYTDFAKRAVFYARASALLNKTTTIDSIHVLRGLMWEQGSGAVSLFALREHFPHYHGCPYLLSELPKDAKDVSLTDDSKRILAYAAMEAEYLSSYSIHPEHLLLGILREQRCPAAVALARAGITIKIARHKVKKSCPPSPPDDLAKPGWRSLSPFSLFIYRWRNR
jgi:ATP-dependent Clp protease ATP-binding subunit ClpC